MSTLLHGGDGAIGLLLASLLVDLFYFFPYDPVLSIAAGIIATVAPYAVYRQSFLLMCGGDSSGALSVRHRSLLHGYKRKKQVEHGLLPLCNR
ncbi:Co/Zn/Cd efflux system component [Paraburkholderia sp. WSM4175]